MQSMIGILKRLRLTLAVLAVLAGVSGPALAKVVVMGVAESEADSVRAYFSGSSPAEVQEGVAALRKTGRFSNVSASRQGEDVVVRVSTGNVINRVAFEGNSKVKSDQLAPELRTKANSVYDPGAAQSDVARVAEIYRRAGRAAAKVSVRTVPLPNGKIDVVYTIEEGDKTGVKEIRFVGNQVYSTGRLVGLMETTEMNFLSFIKTSDVYDPDRIATDLELVRRFYLKNGYADFRVVSSDARFDPSAGGYIITIVVEEGPQYRVSNVDIESHLPDVDVEAMRGQIRLSPGDIYNGDAVEKSVEALTREIAKKGYAFTQARPRGERNPAERTVAIRFVLDEAPRVYVERINIRGNNRTREYVIRREFEIGEGDAYNRVLIDRAERRLNSLGYFKKVKIANEPGSAPDRVIVNVDLEEQPTGNFGVSGGYSTTEGFLGEVSVSDSNFLGRGEAVRVSVQEGQRARGVTFSFTEPYFLDQRLSAGFDLFAKRSDAYNYSIYSSTSIGGTVRFGIPLTDELSISPHYSIYQTTISIPNDRNRPYNDCQQPIPFYTPGFGYIFAPNPTDTNIFINCQSNGEASLAIKESRGARLTSAAGYTLSYNSVDNFKNPHNGFVGSLTQDIAGLGGDTRYVRSAGDLRYFREIPYIDDVVGILHVQGGDVTGIGGYNLRVNDNFNLGPSLVRGFAPGGIGPRDVDLLGFANGAARGNSLGGTDYFGGSAEVQFPIWGIPKDIGLRGAVFADAGTLFGYHGQYNFNQTLFGANLPCTYSYVNAPFYGQGTCLNRYNGKSLNIAGGGKLIGDTLKIRSSVGASLLWNSPLGPIRFDYAFVTSKAFGDVTQAFRFSGGTNF